MRSGYCEGVNTWRGNGLSKGEKKFEDMITRFDSIHELDRQQDGQTETARQCRLGPPIARKNKNLAIANRSRVSCAHNTSRAFIGL